MSFTARRGKETATQTPHYLRYSVNNVSMTVHLLAAVVLQVVTPARAENGGYKQGASVKEFDFQASGFSEHIYGVNPFCRRR